ncbi:MAG TPA: glycosyltransferase family 2 protein [Gemmataceae bacterium]|nr:glycosyltransferase family 2 protein [Gemmataceae bacterium]
MSATQSILAAVVWVCFAAVFYAYFGYPVLIGCLARLVGRRRIPPALRDDELPTVSLLIAAYNEEAVIEERLRNALATDYPKEKWEVVVATDGCSDRTVEMVRRFAGRGVRLLESPQRRGKAATLNVALEQVKGEVVIFSDANTFNEPSAARNLARWFQDPGVTAVCGRLVLRDPETGRNADSLYWKYETFLKRSEGRLGALLGANGGIYAIRKSRHVPIPSGTILDDLVLPLLARLNNGGDIIYDPEAIAHEETAAGVGAEFHRRSRIGAGGFDSVGLLAGLLNPRQGWLFFTFLSHKLLRWCCPFFLLALLLSNALLWEVPFYRQLLLAQVGFYATSLAVAYIPGQFKALKLLRLTTMFTSMNGALLVGFCRWLRKTQTVTWKRTARLAEVQPVGPVVAPVGASAQAIPQQSAA